MKNVIYFLTLLSSSLLFSQNKIEGIIVDSLKNPIQYTNIGILNKSIGTVSNEEGKFILNIGKANLNDTLRVSCFGYKPKQFLVKNIELEKSIKIELEEEVTILEEMNILSGDLKTYSLGKDKTDTKHKVIFADEKMSNINLGTEIGKKFDLGTKKASLLSEFKFYIKNNNFASNTFKINVYSLNKNKPGKVLNPKNIIVSVGENYKGWVTVNLEDYNIIVQEDIIVCVEWINYVGNGNTLHLPVIGPSFGSVHYYKYGSQNRWERYGKVSSSMILTYKQ